VATPDDSNPLLRCVAPYHNPLLSPVLPPRLLAAGGALRRGFLGLALALVFASLEGTGRGASHLQVSVRGGNAADAASHAQALFVGVVALPIEVPFGAAVPAGVAGTARAGLAGIALCMSAGAHMSSPRPSSYERLGPQPCCVLTEEARFACALLHLFTLDSRISRHCSLIQRSLPRHESRALVGAGEQLNPLRSASEL
jgi:hypothetical protein